MHGSTMMSWQQLRESYGRELVNLRNETRYYFLNTLFSVSEGVMYMQVSLRQYIAIFKLHAQWSSFLLDVAEKPLQRGRIQAFFNI